jgi:hypothetical protein
MPDNTPRDTAGNTAREAAVERFTEAYKRSGSLKEVGNFLATWSIVIAVLFALIVTPTSYRTGELIITLLVSGFLGMIGLGVGAVVAALGRILRAATDSAVNTSPFLTDEDRAAAMSLTPPPKGGRSWAAIGIDPNCAPQSVPAKFPRADISPLAVLFAERESFAPVERRDAAWRRRGKRGTGRR